MIEYVFDLLNNHANNGDEYQIFWKVKLKKFSGLITVCLYTEGVYIIKDPFGRTWKNKK
jgi:hypothetical protein